MAVGVTPRRLGSEYDDHMFPETPPATRPEVPDDAPPPVVRRPLLMSLLAVMLILVVGLYPFDFQSRGGEQWLALSDWDVLALVGNVILFIPLGFFEAGLAGVMLSRAFGADADATAGVSSGRGNLVMLLVIIDAALLGLIVETLQLWLPAQSAILDLIANTMGGTAGGILACMFASTRRI